MREETTTTRRTRKGTIVVTKADGIYKSVYLYLNDREPRGDADVAIHTCRWTPWVSIHRLDGTSGRRLSDKVVATKAQVIADIIRGAEG